VFSSSRPVVARAFHDRDQELARLSASLRPLLQGQPRWFALIGQRKVGKTSLVLELARRSSAAGIPVRFVVMDVMEYGPPSLEVFRLFAARTLDAFLSSTAAASFEALLIDASAFRTALAPSLARLPADVHGILLDLPTIELNAPVLRRLVDLPQALAEAVDGHAFVAWDEFQELMALSKRGRPAMPEPIALLRSVWQRHDRVAYLVSGSAPSMLKELVSDRASPFFQHMVLMELGPMDRGDAVALMTANGLAASLAERAFDVLGGNPFYLQLLGEELLEMGGTEEVFNEALQRLLFSATGRLALYLEREYHRVVGHASEMAALLGHVARSGDDGRRVGDLAQAMRTSTGAIAKYVSRLRDVLESTDEGTYRVGDRALRLWIAWRGPGGGVVPMTVLGDEAEQRVAQTFATLGFDLVYQSRASRGAFDLLATRGRQQLGVQVRRRSLPLVFSTAEWSRMESEAHRFGWRWVVCAVEPGSAAVRFLDPRAARVRKTVRLHPDSVIDNLLAWLDADSGEL